RAFRRDRDRADAGGDPGWNPRRPRREPAGPDLVEPVAEEAGGFRPGRRGSVFRDHDRALPGAPAQISLRGHVVEERRPEIGAAPGPSLDLDPASPRRRGPDPDRQHVAGSGGEEPAGVAERDPGDREKKSPERREADAGSPRQIHTSERDLSASRGEKRG